MIFNAFWFPVLEQKGDTYEQHNAALPMGYSLGRIY